jgi:hemerythrin
VKAVGNDPGKPDFFEWNSSYSIDVTEVDQQHRRLIELINQLHDAMTRNRGLGTVPATIDEFDTMAAVLGELIDYASYHFSTEEGYMREYAYPEYAAHRAAHRHFVDRVCAFREDLDGGKPVCSAEITEFLRDWWVSHILRVDKKLGAFLNKRAPA